MGWAGLDEDTSSPNPTQPDPTQPDSTQPICIYVKY